MPPINDLRAYNRAEAGAQGPNLEHFVLDLGNKKVDSRWNEKATIVFADEFVSRGFPYDDKEKVKTYFQGYLRTLRELYKEQEKLASGGEAARIAARDAQRQATRRGRRITVRPLFLHFSRL